MASSARSSVSSWLRSNSSGGSLRDDDSHHVETDRLQAQQLPTIRGNYSTEFADSVDSAFEALPDFDLRFSSPLSVCGSGRSLDDEMLHTTKSRVADSAPPLCKYGESETTPSRMWTPAILHWASLAIFGLFFALTIAGLEILYYFSKKHDGISQADPKNYYLWTYGPTGVFSIVAALWALVEYRVKQQAPWQILRRGPTNAAQTVLLDYVSPWNIISLFKSIKERHYVVTAAISATLLIRFLIVLSTGLLLLQDTPILSSPARFVAFDRFTTDRVNMSAIDSTPALIVAGNASMGLNLPQGTTPDFAYQSFDMLDPNLVSNATLVGTVEAFTANLECQSTNYHFVNNTCGDDPTETRCIVSDLYMSLAASGCTTEDFLATQIVYGTVDVFFSSSVVVKCLGSSPEDDRRRLAIMTGLLLLNHTLSFTGLLCKPKYQIITKVVTLSESGQIQSIGSLLESSPRPLLPTTPWDIWDGIVSSLGSAADQISTWNGSSSDSSTIPIGPLPGVKARAYVPVLIGNADETLKQTGDPFTGLLFVIHPQTRVENFLNETLLLETSDRSFTSMAAQVAKRKLLVPVRAEFPGHINTSQRRLLVQKLSLRAMEATLASLILCTIILLASRPHSLSPRDPGSLIGVLTVLLCSPSLMNAMSQVQWESDKELRSLLTGRYYRSIVSFSSGELTFKIEESQDATEPRIPMVQPPKEDDDDQWWRPFPGSIYTRVLIVLTPVTLIAALEATFQVSQRHKGIADINLDTYVQYSWSSIPALVMLGIRTLFDVVDSYTRGFQPYCSLRSQLASAERSIFVNYLGQTSIQSLYSGLNVRQYSVALMSASMVMAPFLAIIASGLFTANDVAQNLSVQAHRLDWFNTSVFLDEETSATPASRLVSSVIMTTELDYPQWTFHDLVLPRMSLPDDALATMGSSRTTQLRSIALRGGLDCTRLSQDRIIDFTSEDDAFWMSVNIAPECRKGKNPPSLRFFTEQSNETRYFGWLRRIDLLDESDRCGGLIATYGRRNGNSVEEINVMTCTLYLEQVEVVTNISLPGFAILSAKQDEESSNRVSDNLLRGRMDVFDDLPDFKDGRDVYEGIFSILVQNGVKNERIPMTELMGPENFPRLSTALSGIYGQMLAQKINLEARVDSPEPPSVLLPLSPVAAAAGSSTTFQGNLTIPDRSRLQQSLTSTRILQGFLISMALCAALSFYLMKTDKVLPFNPYSIARSASLLAGSRLANPTNKFLPPNSMWYDDKTLKATEAFQTGTFSLKWWPGERIEGVQGPERYGIDIDEDRGDGGKPEDDPSGIPMQPLTARTASLEAQLSSSPVSPISQVADRQDLPLGILEV